MTFIKNSTQATFYREALARHSDTVRLSHGRLAWATQEMMRAAARGDWREMRRVAGWQSKVAADLSEASWRVPVIREALAEWEAR